ncbi:MAG: hypothetical protein WA869_05385, partial [Alloacidobacterium sp.]
HVPGDIRGIAGAFSDGLVRCLLSLAIGEPSCRTADLVLLWPQSLTENAEVFSSSQKLEVQLMPTRQCTFPEPATLETRDGNLCVN